MKIAAGLVALAMVAGGCAQSGSTPLRSAAASSQTSPPTQPSLSVSMSPMTSTPAGSNATGPKVTAPPDATSVEVLDFKILPATLTLNPSFSLFVTNEGPTVHNVTIRDQAGKVIMATPDLRPGDSAVLTGVLAPGQYVTFCSLPGHESLGTKGVLIVKP